MALVAGQRIATMSIKTMANGMKAISARISDCIAALMEKTGTSEWLGVVAMNKSYHEFTTTCSLYTGSLTGFCPERVLFDSATGLTLRAAYAVQSGEAGLSSWQEIPAFRIRNHLLLGLNFRIGTN